MKSDLRKQELKDAIKLAASILGGIGGRNGKGSSKRRSRSVYQAAANARWEAYYSQIESNRKKIKS